MTVLSIDEITPENLADLGSAQSRARVLWARLVISAQPSTRATLYRHLATLIGRGNLRLDEALARIWENESDEGEKANRAICIMLADILHGLLHEGGDLGDLMGRWLAPREALVLASLARTGLKAEPLRYLAKTTVRLATAKANIAKAALPPYAAAVLAVGVGYYLSQNFFPVLFKAMPSFTMRGHGATLVAVSDSLSSYGPMLIGGLVLAPFLAAYSLPRLTGPLRRFLDVTPPFSLVGALYARWTGADWLTAFATYISAGASIPDALEATMSHSSPYVLERLRAVAAYDDRSLAPALAESEYKWPDEKTIRSIRIYMSGPRPGDAVLELAEETTTEILKTMEEASTLISHISALAIGLFLGWFMLAINDLSSSMSNIR